VGHKREAGENVRRHIPNLLTVARFFLALVFFALVAFYDVRQASSADWPLMDVAFLVFLVATLTDAVDGYLARRLGHTTTFGRVADPFVDKILVCGALAYFIGYPFLLPNADGTWTNLTGWQPWMVVLIIARELLVTGMRSFSESHGIAFAASLSGKVKMSVQVVAILWTLAYVGHWVNGPDWTTTVRDGLIWAATLFTFFSGLVYVKRAYHLLRLPPD
jgi:CDP-diacylglycerol--glycerol-3-phosphate 3-phosphatidyltransferase